MRRALSDPVPHSTALPLTPPRLTPAAGHVVVAVAPDGGDDVLRLAWARARARGAPLVVCAVVADAEQRPSALAHLVRRLAELLPARAEVELDVRVGDRADEILASLRQHHAILLVLGPAQREGALTSVFRPGVATALVRAAACPVLLVRGAGGSRHVLATTDLDAPGWPTLRAAADEARRTGGALTVLHCVEPMLQVPAPDFAVASLPSPEVVAADVAATLARAADEVGLTGATLRVEPGAPGAGILAVAHAIAADLIVIGTHGRRGALRLVLGSTAEEVIRDATCDVLVVRHAPAATADATS